MMNAVVLVSFAIAALAVFVGTRLYRHGYTYPRLQGNTAEIKKSLISVIVWLVVLILAIAVWIVVGTPYAPMSGTPFVLITITGIITACAPLVGLVVGVKRGKQRLTRS